MFEKIKDNPFLYNSVANLIVIDCEQETIKRLGWLKRKVNKDKSFGIKVNEVLDLIDQAKTLPIEKIEDELK